MDAGVVIVIVVIKVMVMMVLLGELVDFVDFAMKIRVVLAAVLVLWIAQRV